MPVDIGTTASVEWTLDASAGGHSVTLAVHLPDGTLLDPAPTVSEAGEAFRAEFLTTQPGRHLLRWTDTTDGVVKVDILDVWPTDPRFLVSVDAAAGALRWRPADKAANLETLRLYVAAATEVIEDIVGAVLIRTVVQTADGGRTGVALWERPSEIVSVTVDGTAKTDFKANLNAAIVYADKHGSRFPDGIQTIVITYRTGETAVPPSIQLATLELVRHLWQVGQQALVGDGSPAYNPASGQMENTRTGFAVPRRVIELCGNRYALPGLA